MKYCHIFRQSTFIMTLSRSEAWWTLLLWGIQISRRGIFLSLFSVPIFDILKNLDFQSFHIQIYKQNIVIPRAADGANKPNVLLLNHGIKLITFSGDLHSQWHYQDRKRGEHCGSETSRFYGGKLFCPCSVFRVLTSWKYFWDL